jgi:hypothetical protein
METEYLKFMEIPTAGKTQSWNVCNKQHGDKLGIIKWYGPWRQYCYFPTIQAVYSTGCLQDINNFIKVEMQKRKLT